MHPVPVSQCHRGHVGSAISSCCGALLVPSQHLVCGEAGCVPVAVGCVEISVCGSQVREAGRPVPKGWVTEPLSTILLWPRWSPGLCR